MEKAILTLNPKKAIKDFILYRGSYSCSNILIRSLNIMLDQNIKSSVIFPITTDSIIEKTEPLLKKIYLKKLIDEAIVNDIGSAYYIRKNFRKLKINIGIIWMLSISKTFYYHKYLEDIIKRFRINAIKLYLNLLKIFKNFKIPINLNIPYSILVITRFCLFERRWIYEKCNFNCLGRTKKLYSKSALYPIYLNESVYYKKDLDANSLLKLDNISRIVINEHII